MTVILIFKCIELKFFIIPVRDVLHDKLPHVSRNKTSRACQRRINYMIKNPTTLSNVNLFLAEVKQDVIVINKFPIPERGEISRDENDKRMKRDFPPLLDILVEKFKRKFTSEGDLEKIPEDLDELKQRFLIQIPENHLREEKFTGRVTKILSQILSTNPKSSIKLK